MKIEDQKQWLAQWQAAAVALRQQKLHELAHLSDSAAQQATQSVLALAGQVRPGHRRWTSSGLVEQQRRLHRRQIS